MAKSRKLAGARAKSRGQQFETLISGNAAATGWIDIRIPDGCKQIGARNLVRVKSPFDYIIAKSVSQATILSIPRLTKTILFDAKSTSENRYYIKSKNDHQLDELMRFTKLDDYACGYIVNYDKHGCVVFHNVTSLKRARAAGRGLKHDEGIVIGNKFKINFEQVFLASSAHALGVK